VVELLDSLDGLITLEDIYTHTYKELSYLQESYIELKKRKYPNGKYPRLF